VAAVAPPGDAFAYACDLYARPGAKAACLALQDEAGADVCLLLIACWAARDGRALNATAARRLAATAGPWRRRVIAPLRRVRRAVGDWPATETADLDQFRSAAAQLEIDAERLAILRGAALVRGMALAGATTPGLARHNLWAVAPAAARRHPALASLAEVASMING
jgi:uncharacterized protein (TIGR02444 family)